MHPTSLGSEDISFWMESTRACLRSLHIRFGPIFRSAFNIGDNNTALYHFGVVIDPLSEAAQRWSSLMEVNYADLCILIN